MTNLTLPNNMNTNVRANLSKSFVSTNNTRQLAIKNISISNAACHSEKNVINDLLFPENKCDKNKTEKKLTSTDRFIFGLQEKWGKQYQKSKDMDYDEFKAYIGGFDPDEEMHNEPDKPLCSKHDAVKAGAFLFLDISASLSRYITKKGIDAYDFFTQNENQAANKQSEFVFFPCADASFVHQTAADFLTPEEYEKQTEVDRNAATASVHHENEANIAKIRSKRRIEYKATPDQLLNFDVDNIETQLANTDFDELKALLMKPISDWDSHANPQLARLNEIRAKMQSMCANNPEMQRFFRDTLDAIQVALIERSSIFRDGYSYYWTETDKAINEKNQFFFHAETENFFPKADEPLPYQRFSSDPDILVNKAVHLLGEIYNKISQGMALNYQQLGLAFANFNVDATRMRTRKNFLFHSNSIKGWHGAFGDDATLANYRRVAQHLRSRNLDSSILYPTFFSQTQFELRAGAGVSTGNVGICQIMTNALLMNMNREGIAGWQDAKNFVNKLSELYAGDPIKASRVYAQLNQMNTDLQNLNFYSPSRQRWQFLYDYEVRHPSFDDLMTVLVNSPTNTGFQISIDRKKSQSGGHIVGLSSLEIDGNKLYIINDPNLGLFPCFSIEQLKSVMNVSLKVLSNTLHSRSDLFSEVEFSSVALKDEFLKNMKRAHNRDQFTSEDVAAGNFEKLNFPIDMGRQPEWANYLPNTQAFETPLNSNIEVYKGFDATRMERAYTYTSDNDANLENMHDLRVSTQALDQAIKLASTAEKDDKPISRIPIPISYSLAFEMPDIGEVPPPKNAQTIMRLIDSSEGYSNQDIFAHLKTLIRNSRRAVGKAHFEEVFSAFKDVYNNSHNPASVKGIYTEILDNVFNVLIENSKTFRDAVSYYMYRTEIEAIQSGKRYHDISLDGYFHDIDFQRMARDEPDFMSKMCALLASIHIDANEKVDLNYATLGMAFADLTLNRFFRDTQVYVAEQEALTSGWESTITTAPKPSLNTMLHEITTAGYLDEVSDIKLTLRGMAVDSGLSSKTTSYGHLMSVAMMMEIQKHGIHGLKNARDLLEKFNALSINDPIASVRVAQGLENTVNALQAIKLSDNLGENISSDVLDLASRCKFTQFEDVITHVAQSGESQFIVMRDSDANLRGISVARMPLTREDGQKISLPVVIDPSMGIIPCYSITQLKAVLRTLVKRFIPLENQVDSSIYGVYELTASVTDALEKTTIQKGQIANPYLDLFTLPLEAFQEASSITQDVNWRARFFTKLDDTPAPSVLTSEMAGYRRSPQFEPESLCERFLFGLTRSERVYGDAGEFEAFLARAAAIQRGQNMKEIDPFHAASTSASGSDNTIRLVFKSDEDSSPKNPFLFAHDDAQTQMDVNPSNQKVEQFLGELAVSSQVVEGAQEVEHVYKDLGDLSASHVMKEEDIQQKAAYLNKNRQRVLELYAEGQDDAENVFSADLVRADELKAHTENTVLDRQRIQVEADDHSSQKVEKLGATILENLQWDETINSRQLTERMVITSKNPSVANEDMEITAISETIKLREVAKPNQGSVLGLDQQKLINHVLDLHSEENLKALFDEETLTKLRSGEMDVLPKASIQEMQADAIKIKRTMQETSAQLTEHLRVNNVPVDDVELVNQLSSKDDIVQFRRRSTGQLVDIDVSDNHAFKTKVQQLEVMLKKKVNDFTRAFPNINAKGFNPLTMVWDLYGRSMKLAGQMVSAYSFCALLQQSLNMETMDTTAKAVLGLSLADVAVDNISNAMNAADWMLTTFSAPIQELTVMSNAMNQISTGVSIVIGLVEIGLFAYSLNHAKTDMERKLAELFLDMAILRTALMGVTIAISAVFPPAAPVMATLGFLLMVLQNHLQAKIISKEIANEYYEVYEKEMREVYRLLNEPDAVFDFKEDSLVIVSNKLPYTRLTVSKDKMEMLKDGKPFANKFLRSVMKRGAEYPFRVFKEPSSPEQGGYYKNHLPEYADLRNYDSLLSEISLNFMHGYANTDNFDLTKRGVTGSGYTLGPSLVQLGWIKKKNGQYVSDIHFDEEWRQSNTIAECLDKNASLPIIAPLISQDTHRNIVISGHPAKITYVAKSCKKVSWNGYAALPTTHRTIHQLNWCGAANNPALTKTILTEKKVDNGVVNILTVPAPIHDGVQGSIELETLAEGAYETSNEPRDTPQSKDKYWRVRQSAETVLRVDSDWENKLQDRTRYKGQLFAVELNARYDTSNLFTHLFKVSLDTSKYCYDVPEDVELEFVLPEFVLSSGGETSHIYHFPPDSFAQKLRDKPSYEHYNYGLASGFPITKHNADDEGITGYSILMQTDGEHNFVLYPGTMLVLKEEAMEAREKKGNIHFIVSFDLLNEHRAEKITEYDTSDERHHIQIKLDGDEKHNINLLLEKSVTRPLEIALNSPYTDHGRNTTITTGVQLLPPDLHRLSTQNTTSSTQAPSATAQKPRQSVGHVLNYITDIPLVHAQNMSEKIITNAHRIFPDLQSNAVRLANIDLIGSKYHEDLRTDDKDYQAKIKAYKNVDALTKFQTAANAISAAVGYYSDFQSFWASPSDKKNIVLQIKNLSKTQWNMPDLASFLPNLQGTIGYYHYSQDMLCSQLTAWARQKLRDKGCEVGAEQLTTLLKHVALLSSTHPAFKISQLFLVFKRAFVSAVTLRSESVGSFNIFANDIIVSAAEQGHYDITHEDHWDNLQAKQGFLNAFTAKCFTHEEATPLGLLLTQRLESTEVSAYSTDDFVSDVSTWVQSTLDVKGLKAGKAIIKNHYELLANFTTPQGEDDLFEDFLRANGLQQVKRGMLKGIHAARDLSLVNYLADDNHAAKACSPLIDKDEINLLPVDAKWHANAWAIPAEKGNLEGKREVVPTVWRSKHKGTSCPFSAILNNLSFLHTEKVAYDEVPEALRHAFTSGEKVDLHYFIDVNSKILALQYGSTEIRWWDSSDFMWGGTNKVFHLKEIGGVAMNRLVCDPTLGALSPAKNPYSHKQTLVSGYLAPMKTLFSASGFVGKIPLLAFIKEYTNKALQSSKEGEKSTNQKGTIDNLLLILDNSSFSNQGVSFASEKPHQVLISYQGKDSARVAVLNDDETLLFANADLGVIHFKKEVALAPPAKGKVLRVFSREMKNDLYSEEISSFRDSCVNQAYSKSIYSAFTQELSFSSELNDMFYDSKLGKFIAHFVDDVVVALNHDFSQAGLLQIGKGYLEYQGLPNRGKTTTEKVLNDYKDLKRKYGALQVPLMFYMEGKAFSPYDPVAMRCNIFIEQKTELPVYIPTSITFNGERINFSENIALSYTLPSENPKEVQLVLHDPHTKAMISVKNPYVALAKGKVFFQYDFMSPLDDMLYLGLKSAKADALATLPYLGVEQLTLLPSETQERGLSLPKLTISSQAQHHLRQLVLSAPDTSSGQVQPISINNGKVGLDQVQMTLYRNADTADFVTLSVPSIDSIDNIKVASHEIIILLNRALNAKGKARPYFHDTIEINGQKLTKATLNNLIKEANVIDTSASPSQLFLQSNSTAKCPDGQAFVIDASEFKGHLSAVKLSLREEEKRQDPPATLKLVLRDQTGSHFMAGRDKPACSVTDSKTIRGGTQLNVQFKVSQGGSVQTDAKIDGSKGLMTIKFAKDKTIHISQADHCDLPKNITSCGETKMNTGRNPKRVNKVFTDV